MLRGRRALRVRRQAECARIRARGVDELQRQADVDLERAPEHRARLRVRVWILDGKRRGGEGSARDASARRCACGRRGEGARAREEEGEPDRGGRGARARVGVLSEGTQDGEEVRA